MNNGFKVNTDIKYGKKRKINIVKFIKRNFMLFGVLFILVVALAVFISVMSVGCSKKSDSKGSYVKTATAKDGSIKYVEYYGADGQLTKREDYYENEIKSITENTYKNGLLTESKISYWGEPFQHIVYEYDGKNKTVKTVYDASDGNLSSLENFYYDDNKVLTSSVVTDTNGIQTYKYEYTFENGKMVTEVMYDIENDYTRTTTYTYEGDRLVKENVVAGAYHNMTTEYTYNSRGLVSMEKKNSGEDNYTSFTYEFGK